MKIYRMELRKMERRALHVAIKLSLPIGLLVCRNNFLPRVLTKYSFLDLEYNKKNFINPVHLGHCNLFDKVQPVVLKK